MPTAGRAGGGSRLLLRCGLDICCVALADRPRPGRAVSSAGRASVLHTEGRRFEPVTAHQTARPPDCLATKLPGHKAAGAVTEMGRAADWGLSPTDSSGAERARPGGVGGAGPATAPGGVPGASPPPDADPVRARRRRLTASHRRLSPASRRTAWPSDPVAGVAQLVRALACHARGPRVQVPSLAPFSPPFRLPRSPAREGPVGAPSLGRRPPGHPGPGQRDRRAGPDGCGCSSVG